MAPKERPGHENHQRLDQEEYDRDVIVYGERYAKTKRGEIPPMTEEEFEEEWWKLMKRIRRNHPEWIPKGGWEELCKERGIDPEDGLDK